MMTLLEVIAWAIEAHKMQTRKGGGTYVTHLSRVALGVERLGGDLIAIKAAWLHDTIEDTDCSFDDLRAVFGIEVASVVKELSDNKELPKARRKALTIEHAPVLSFRASLVKRADCSDNMQDIVANPPPSWSSERVDQYMEWGNAVIAALPPKPDTSEEVRNYLKKYPVQPSREGFCPESVGMTWEEYIVDINKE